MSVIIEFIELARPASVATVVFLPWFSLEYRISSGLEKAVGDATVHQAPHPHHQHTHA
jgi:hypothetical protein